jgi:hypothetical protein
VLLDVFIAVHGGRIATPVTASLMVISGLAKMDDM